MIGIFSLLVAIGQLSASAPTQTPEVTVTASRDSERELKEFVDALTVGRANDQIGRFAEPICPFAWGMTDPQKIAVTTRFRRVAVAAGLEVDKAKCAPNVLILVTQDKEKFVRALAKRYPYWFRDTTGENPFKMSRMPVPAVVWQVLGVALDRSGMPLAGSQGSEVIINRTAQAASRIGNPARPQFAAAIMVVDAKSLVGITTTQLADYAAMRTLMVTRPERVPVGTATILGVLDAPMGSEIPLSLSERDLAALRSFHASDPYRSTEAQRAAIRRDLKCGTAADR